MRYTMLFGTVFAMACNGGIEVAEVESDVAAEREAEIVEAQDRDGPDAILEARPTYLADEASAILLARVTTPRQPLSSSNHDDKVMFRSAVVEVSYDGLFPAELPLVEIHGDMCPTDQDSLAGTFIGMPGEHRVDLRMEDGRPPAIERVAFGFYELILISTAEPEDLAGLRVKIVDLVTELDVRMDEESIAILPGACDGLPLVADRSSP